MTLVPAGSARIYTETHGDGDDLLLVPGLGGRAQFWANQVTPFARQFRVILHDHRGTGRSSRSRVRYSIRQMADDVLRVMDHHRVAASHFVGHSTGGAIGQYLALRHPDRIRSLVLSATWCGPDALFTDLFRHRRDVLKKCGAAAYLFEGTMLATPAAHLQRTYADSLSTLAARLKDFPGTTIETSRIGAVMAHDLRRQVHRIAIPTLVIGARDDQITPPGFSEELARRIPGAKLILLPSGGHFCPMTEPETYNRRVLAFLRAARSPRP
jgi:aminoacrylate hydrolase